MFHELVDSTKYYDVIIVGGGLSGLSAGYYLKKIDKNLRILIVEAKDRVGGRTQTLKFKCSKDGHFKEWDVGGQWVTDTQENITNLLNELQIPTYRQYDLGIRVLEANKKIYQHKSSTPNLSIAGLIDFNYVIRKFDKFCKKVNTLDPFMSLKKLDKTNSREFFFKNSLTNVSKGLFDEALRAIFGVEPIQLNALFVSMYIKSSGGSFNAITSTDDGCAQNKKVKGGTQQISEKLLNSILSDGQSEIIYESPLIEVYQKNDKVYIRVANKNELFSCNKLISSIPINQYNNIKFTPNLPFYKKNVFEFCKVGSYIKTIITYKKAFWREKGFSGMAISDGSIKNNEISNYPKYGPITETWDGCTDDGEPALIVFTCAQAAVEWLDMADEIRKKEILNSLSRYYGPEAFDYIDYYEKNWNAEPYNGGCPCINVISADIMKDYARATREPFINIHFCGTESATKWQGYMDGAIESGIRVANEIAYCLNKSNDYSKTYYYQNEEINRLKAIYKKSNNKIFKYFIIAITITTLSFVSFRTYF